MMRAARAQPFKIISVSVGDHRVTLMRTDRHTFFSDSVLETTSVPLVEYCALFSHGGGD